MFLGDGTTFFIDWFRFIWLSINQKLPWSNNEYKSWNLIIISLIFCLFVEKWHFNVESCCTSCGYLSNFVPLSQVIIPDSKIETNIDHGYWWFISHVPTCVCIQPLCLIMFMLVRVHIIDFSLLSSSYFFHVFCHPFIPFACCDSWILIPPHLCSPPIHLIDLHTLDVVPMHPQPIFVRLPWNESDFISTWLNRTFLKLKSVSLRFACAPGWPYLLFFSYLSW